MEPDPTPTPHRRRTLVGGALAAAALALAVPASGALAGSNDASGTNATEPSGTSGFVQERDRDARPEGGRDKGDCPEHERRGGEREGSSGQSFDESREL